MKNSPRTSEVLLFVITKCFGGNLTREVFETHLDPSHKTSRRTLQLLIQFVNRKFARVRFREGKSHLGKYDQFWQHRGVSMGAGN